MVMSKNNSMAKPWGNKDLKNLNVGRKELEFISKLPIRGKFDFESTTAGKQQNKKCTIVCPSKVVEPNASSMFLD